MMYDGEPAPENKVGRSEVMKYPASFRTLPALSGREALLRSPRMSTCTEAAKSGYVWELIRLRQIESPWSEETTLAAAGEGHLEVLKWAINEKCPFDAYELCSISAQNGHFLVLLWLHLKFCPSHSENAAGGECDCLLTRVSEAAGMGGFPEVLEYLYRIATVLGQCFYYEDVCEGAARAGRLDVLMWVVEKGIDGFEWTAGICDSAINGGNTEVIQYIREQSRFAIDKELCFAAITEDRLDMLQWCIDNGCQWSVLDKDSTGMTGLEIAQAKGYTHIVNFLVTL